MADTQIQTGIGVAWGISASSYAIGAALKVIASSETRRKFSKKIELLDKVGEVQGLVYYDARAEIQLEIFPSDATLALAETAAAVCPAIGAVMIITDSDDAEVAGTYLVKESSKVRKNSDKVSFTVTLVQFENTITTTIA